MAPPGDDRDPERPAPSWGNISDRHWSRAREGRNEEALEYYRRRSRAPGVAEGGGPRNAYCMECDGVIPIAYAQFDPASDERRTCPHCGAELDPRVQRMFNWVEIDQPHGSDLRAILPFLIAGAVLLVGVAAGLLVWML